MADTSKCSICGKRFRRAGGRTIVYDVAGLALRAEHLPGECRVIGKLFAVSLPSWIRPTRTWEPVECTTPMEVSGG